MKSAVVGMRVALTILGEEIGWDEDRGRPEAVEPDRKVVGRLSRIGRTLPGTSDRQVCVSYEGETPGEIVDEWGWLSNCEPVR